MQGSSATLPHDTINASKLNIIYIFYSKGIVYLPLNRDFLEFFVLVLGFEPTTFRLMSTCTSISFLTAICISAIDDFAPVVGQYSGNITQILYIQYSM